MVHIYPYMDLNHDLKIIFAKFKETYAIMPQGYWDYVKQI